MSRKSIYFRTLLGICGIAAICTLICYCYANADIVSYSQNTFTSEEEGVVDILFTSDLHSYLEAYDTFEDGEQINIGGMERLSTIVKAARTKNSDVLLFDGGDYPMGTLYQTLFSERALEYRTLSKIGFDAITFGNHDFDYGAEKMAEQFEAAKENCDYYPDFVICNADWSKIDEGTQLIYNSLKDMKLAEYVIYEKNGLKIGVTGVFGYDALKSAPTCELTFKDPVESLKATVSKMKQEENPDMIVVLSHSGTAGNSGETEDEILAKEVPDVDFILSAHAHLKLENPLVVGNTFIGACGSYGRYTGYIKLKKNDSGRFDLVDYELISMDESVDSDPEIVNMLDGFKEEIDENYLSRFGYTAEQVVAENSINFDSVEDLYEIHTGHNLGEIIADAYRWTTEEYGSKEEDSNPVDVTVSPSGTIRGSYLAGNITVEDVYNSFSLGMGKDGVIGYPLVNLYLSGSELKLVAEIDATVSDLMHNARLYMSGLQMTFNPHRILLNKVVDTKLTDLSGNVIGDIEDDKLYRVVTDLYTMNMLGSVTDVSYGLLSVVPKKIDGTPIEDYKDVIIHDENGEVIKAWVAIAKYMLATDDDGDGVGNIPQSYVNSDSRKIIIDSWNPIQLIKNPNKFFFIIIGVVVVLLLILFFLIKLLIFIVRKIFKLPPKKSRKQRKLEESTKITNGIEKTTKNDVKTSEMEE